MLKTDPQSDTGALDGIRRGVAIVTGGRRGIGAAVCIELARNGFDIAIADIVVDNNGERIAEEIKALGRNSKFFKLDIADIGTHQPFVADVVHALGPISCLVNNAGLQVPVRGDILEETTDAFDSVVATNLRGTFFLTQAVARMMISARGDDKSMDNTIVFITSANAGMASPEKSSYCISKSALSMVSKLFALRLADQNIWVHEVRPGLIQTDMTAEVFEKYSAAIDDGVSPIRRWGQPQDVAQCVSALATHSVGFTTGDVFNIGGGLHIERL
jgi:NAD(P)-dependent dehydrogenase (short-subunit alcohol dehydrogenase family)